jgi:type I restriction enzyme, S subunit
MSWTTTRLKYVARVGYGLGQPPILSDTGIPILRATNIMRGKFASHGLIYAAKEDLPLDRAPLLREGEILVVRSGAYTGDSAMVTEAWAGSAPGYDLRVSPTSAYPAYIAYCLLSVATLDQVDLAKSRAAQPHLNAEDLGDVSVHLPPLDEQRHIADFLDVETARIDSLLNTQRQTKAILLERRIAGVCAAVTGRDITERMPSKLAWADTLPAAWQSVKLGHFARMGSGHTPSRSHSEWWEDCSIPWITTGEVSQVRDDRQEVLTETRERISEIGMANSSAELHPKGTVVLCRTASAGYSAVMGEDMATSQDFVTWTCGTHLDPFYLLWCLRGMRSDLLGRLAMGSTHKTIYVPDLQALRIPLPPLAEQHQIVADIRAANTAIDTVIDSLDRQSNLLAERRQALITAAVTEAISV